MTENAWDCGTGNGQVAKILAGFFNEVQATDISQNQLEIIESEFKSAWGEGLRKVEFPFLIRLGTKINHRGLQDLNGFNNPLPK